MPRILPSKVSSLCRKMYSVESGCALYNWSRTFSSVCYPTKKTEGQPGQRSCRPCGKCAILRRESRENPRYFRAVPEVRAEHEGRILFRTVRWEIILFIASNSSERRNNDLFHKEEEITFATSAKVSRRASKKLTFNLFCYRNVSLLQTHLFYSCCTSA